jgi:serine/threonine-protein kinase RsbT
MRERSENSDAAENLGTSIRPNELRVASEDDILHARQQARTVAEEMGFSITDCTRIVTAVSELARNIHLYADSGVMRWQEIDDGVNRGLELTFDDDGPGIDDVDGVLRGEHSTSDGMGRGIRGTKKLMDEFELTSSPEDGTTIVIRKWK